MIRANVDTPWAFDGGRYIPQLAVDPAFASLLKGRTDITGENWHEFDGQQVKGGNYALASGMPKSGLPDYLTIQIKVEDEQTLIDID